MPAVLFERGDFTVRRERFGTTEGFAIYRNDGTAAVRVASIGYSGQRGLTRAIAECERRANASQPKPGV